MRHSSILAYTTAVNQKICIREWEICNDLDFYKYLLCAQLQALTFTSTAVDLTSSCSFDQSRVITSLMYLAGKIPVSPNPAVRMTSLFDR